MNVDIPRANTKIFIKSIQALMKTGDEIYFDLYTNRLSICTLNAAKTVNVRFEFHTSFFTCFYSDESAEKFASASASESFSKGSDKHCYSKCKLSSKSFHSLFKSYSNPLDKEVENFRIIFAPKEKDRIVFRFTYCTGVVKTHWIRILEQDSNPIKSRAKHIQENVMKPKHLSSTLCEVLSNFQSNENELSIDVTDPNRINVVFRNFVENEALIAKIVRSQVTLFGPSEFDVFSIKRQTAITVLLKPFKAAIQFADMFRLPVSIRFNGPESPLIILMENSTLYIEFMISVLLSDEEHTLSESVDEPQAVNPNNNEQDVNNRNVVSETQKSSNVDLETKNMTVEPDSENAERHAESHVSLVETEVQNLGEAEVEHLGEVEVGHLGEVEVEPGPNQTELDDEEPVCEEFTSDLVEQLDEPMAAIETAGQETRVTTESLSSSGQNRESQSENYHYTKILFEDFLDGDASTASRTNENRENFQITNDSDTEVFVESSQRSDCN